MKKFSTEEISQKFNDNDNNDDNSNYVIFKSEVSKQIYVCFSHKAISIDYAKAIGNHHHHHYYYYCY